MPLYFSSISFLSSSRTLILRAVKISLTGSGAAALANSMALAFPIPDEAPVIRIYPSVITWEGGITVLFARLDIVRVEWNVELSVDARNDEVLWIDRGRDESLEKIEGLRRSGIKPVGIT